MSTTSHNQVHRDDMPYAEARRTIRDIAMAVGEGYILILLDQAGRLILESEAHSQEWADDLARLRDAAATLAAGPQRA